jgi:hypothetical protein
MREGRLLAIHSTGGSAVTMTACRQKTGSFNNVCLDPPCSSDFCVTPQQACIIAGASFSNILQIIN